MRPRTWPPASMMCQRVSASADCALGMKVDDISLTLYPELVPELLGGFPPGQHSVGQVQATVNPNHTELSGHCQAASGRQCMPSKGSLRVLPFATAARPQSR